MVRGQFHADRATDHRREQRHRDHDPEHRERGHHLLSPPRRLKRDDGEGDEYGQHDKGDQQVSPQRDVADAARHMALEPQPHQRLDELVGTEQHGDPRQGDELPALADMADGDNADRANQQAAGDVGLRREAHAVPSQPAYLLARLLARLSVAR